MSEIAKTIGQRIRNYRVEKGLSQEKLAELSGCHPTYIGQVERGEKNATLESIAKIASAMNISLAKLFEKVGDSSVDSYPMKCYELVASKSKPNRSTCTKCWLKSISIKINNVRRHRLIGRCLLFNMRAHRNQVSHSNRQHTAVSCNCRRNCPQRCKQCRLLPFAQSQRDRTSRPARFRHPSQRR